MAEVRQRRQPTEKLEPFPPASPYNDEEPQWSWTDYSSWPASVKSSPLYIGVFILAIVMLYRQWVIEPPLDMTSYKSCKNTFNYTIRVNAVRHQAEHLSTKSWELGTAVEAIEELLNPEKTVFGADPFPRDAVPLQDHNLDPALLWVYQRISMDGKMLFHDGDEAAATDPASLGVAAVMLGRRWESYRNAAERQKDFLLNDAPRYINGAISHRKEVAELWSDAISMFPPFLAFHGVATKDMAVIKTAVHQIQLYRDALAISEGPKQHLWKHIVGPSDMADEGAWSTGNGWAAYGMARVRATISAWKPSNATMQDEIKKLDRWIGEILDGAIRTDDDESGLLRNYLGQESWWGETSGTSLLAATAYRMALLNPGVYAQPKYLAWADAKRRAVLSRVDGDGHAKPAVNPLKHSSREPVDQSPEGASFLLMLGSAWRDCVCRRICSLED